MSDQLKILYVDLSKAVLWDRNPKKHDLGALANGIRRYGFRDASIYDATLGAIAAGNGRLQALMQMKEAGEEAPRGVKVRADGSWWVPVQHGVDATSKAEAEAFGLDHNNLTVMGGDLGVDAILGLWEEPGLKGILQDLAAADALPVTLDGDDLDALLAPPPHEPTEKGSVHKVCTCPNCGHRFAPAAKVAV